MSSQKCRVLHISTRVRRKCTLRGKENCRGRDWEVTWGFDGTSHPMFSAKLAEIHMFQSPFACAFRFSSSILGCTVHLSFEFAKAYVIRVRKIKTLHAQERVTSYFKNQFPLLCI